VVLWSCSNKGTKGFATGRMVLIIDQFECQSSRIGGLAETSNGKYTRVQNLNLPCNALKTYDHSIIQAPAQLRIDWTKGTFYSGWIGGTVGTPYSS
jgi:hypothetical protein